MSDGPDIPGWAYVLGAGFGGAAVKAVADFCKVRLRQKSGDRRQAETGWGKLIDRLEKRLDATEQEAKDASVKAETAASRLADCEKGHTACRTELSILRRAMNEMREAAGMQLLPEGSGD